MNTGTLIIINVIMLFLITPFGLYLCGRVFIPIMAERDIFFSSPKLGRIKARKRGGKIVKFFDNVVGKNKHVNHQTGKIEDGEILHRGFWWKYFGAQFIGLDEVYKYKIATEAMEDEKGNTTYTEKEASSIFIDGSYPLTAQFVTKDGVRLIMKIQLKLSTVDAAKALSLPISWTIPVFAAVLGASRDFFGMRDIRTIISANNEGGEAINGENGFKSSEFINQILNLNTPKIGNIPLAEICGQRIDAVNLVDVDFVDEEARRAYSSPFIASQEARAIAMKGKAEAEVYNQKHESMGGDSKATAQVITAERQSTMGNLTTLVNGGNTGSVISIPTKEKKDE